MNPIVEFQKKYGLTPDGVVGKNTLLKMMEVFGKTKEEIAYFMGNGKVESGNFTKMRENMNYSAQRILKIFPYQFKKDFPKAKEYEYNPEKLANYVDDDNNRSDKGELGNTIYVQGWNYRGVGGSMTTRHYEMLKLSQYLKNPQIMENPDLVWQDYYFESMLYFFDRKNIWKHCKLVSDAGIAQVRQRVNGGFIGLKEVTEATKEYYQMLK